MGDNSHAQNVAAQLRDAEEDDDLDDDLRKRARERREEIEDELDDEEEPVTDGGIVREYDSPHEKLRQEFDILMGQNNTAIRKTPAYTIGQLFQLVDAFRRKHGLDIEEVREEDNGVYLLLVTGGEVDEVAAAVGLDDPEQVADLDVAMVDDRKLGGGE